VGLKLSLLLSVILFTGTLAVVSHEIDWAITPSLRVAPSSVGAEPDWAAMARAASDYPGVQRIMALDQPTASAFAARATVVWDDGDRLGFLHLHPATGAVQGEGHWVNAQRILRNFHRHLNMPTKYGVPIVTSLAFLMLVSFVTSFVVYKKWWRGFRRLPRRRDARTWWGDFHRLAGVWSLWFVALIVATSIWYFIESVGGDAPRQPRAEAPGLVASAPAVGDRFAPALAAARAADPALDIDYIRFPDEKDGVFIFEGQKTAWLVRSRANAVFVDAATARPLLTTDAAALGVHQRVSEMADPLHFGTFGGYWTKLPWFLFGLLLTGLAVSGVAIYALRIGKELKLAVLGTRDVLVMGWLGMGRWRWLSALLLVVGVALIGPLFFTTAE
jgi:uncharacterized iron-regulated membrane protein